jgi:hypothetical protein
MSARPPPPPRPRLALPPRSTAESLFTGAGDASPGPLTLASALFPSDADGGGGPGGASSSAAGAATFTQLLTGSLAPPPQQQQQQHEAQTGGGGVARAGPALSVAPPASSSAGASLFTVPPGLSPSGLLDSPGLLFSPAMVRPDGGCNFLLEENITSFFCFISGAKNSFLDVACGSWLISFGELILFVALLATNIILKKVCML